MMFLGLIMINNTIKILKETNIPFVIHHMQGIQKQCKKIQNIIMLF